ncbi:MAG: hypothetical protein K2O32_05490, partial [Acetatifactor sp.]|nr:hypothetical protein [Acetatifactor sp.]
MCRKKTKLLAVLLAASLLFQSTGITVMAEPTPTDQVNIESVSSSDLISAGDAVMGSSIQEPDSDVSAGDSSLESDRDVSAGDSSLESDRDVS